VLKILHNFNDSGNLLHVILIFVICRTDSRDFGNAATYQALRHGDGKSKGGSWLMTKHITADDIRKFFSV